MADSKTWASAATQSTTGVASRPQVSTLARKTTLASWHTCSWHYNACCGQWACIGICETHGPPRRSPHLPPNQARQSLRRQTVGRLRNPFGGGLFLVARKPAGARHTALQCAAASDGAAASSCTCAGASVFAIMVRVSCASLYNSHAHLR